MIDRTHRIFISIILLWLVISSLSLSAQNKLSSNEAKGDLDFLYKKMIQIHPGLFRYQKAEDYEKTYKELSESISDSIAYLDFFNKMSPMIYEVKDLHTSHSHSKSWSKKHSNVLPFISKRIGDKNLIQYNASSDSTLYKGLELVEIDGKPIEEIRDELKMKIGTDNGNLAAKELYSSRVLYAYYPKYFELKDSVNLIVRNVEQDSLIAFRLATVAKKKMGATIARRYPKQLRNNLDYAIIDSSLSLAKIDITSFVLKSGPLDFLQKKFKKKLKKDFKQVKKDGIQNLILDMRGNGGGYIPNVGRVLKYVVKEPYKLIDTMAFKRTAYFKIFSPFNVLAPLVAPFYFNKKTDIYRYKANGKPAKKKPSRLAFDGNLFVFMDGGSYSATAFTISVLDDMQRATFVGENPGGANWGSHAGSWFIAKLPNSKIRVRIPEYRIVHTRKKRDNEPLFVQPDIPVEYTQEDFDANKDSYEQVLIEKLKSSNK